MLQFLGTPRAPFTDWCAQVERHVARASGEQWNLQRDCPAVKACYDVGMSPMEVAEVWEDYRNA